MPGYFLRVVFLLVGAVTTAVGVSLADDTLRNGTDSKREARIYLTIAEGYAKERVVISAGDEVVFDQVVTSNESIGVAKRMDMVKPQPFPDLKISIPRLNLVSSQVVDLKNGAYFEVALWGGRIHWRQTKAVIMKD